MSATYQTTIWCDDCGVWEQASLGIMHIRKKLKKNGWSHSRSSDYCQNCTNKRKKEKNYLKHRINLNILTEA